MPTGRDRRRPPGIRERAARGGRRPSAAADRGPKTRVPRRGGRTRRPATESTGGPPDGAGGRPCRVIRRPGGTAIAGTATGCRPPGGHGVSSVAGQNQGLAGLPGRQRVGSRPARRLRRRPSRRPRARPRARRRPAGNDARGRCGHCAPRRNAPRPTPARCGSTDRRPSTGRRPAGRRRDRLEGVKQARAASSASRPTAARTARPAAARTSAAHCGHRCRCAGARW